MLFLDHNLIDLEHAVEAIIYIVIGGGGLEGVRRVRRAYLHRNGNPGNPGNHADRRHFDKDDRKILYELKTELFRSNGAMEEVICHKEPDLSPSLIAVPLRLEKLLKEIRDRLPTKKGG